MKFISFCLSEKKMCLVYLVCYFQSCEQQEKSNLVPILGALSDGRSLLPSVWEPMGSWQHHPVQYWHHQWKDHGTKVRGVAHAEFFPSLEGSQALPAEQARGLRDTVHCPCPQGSALFLLGSGQWAHSLISASPDSTGRSTNRPACEELESSWAKFKVPLP